MTTNSDTTATPSAMKMGIKNEENKCERHKTLNNS